MFIEPRSTRPLSAMTWGHDLEFLAAALQWASWYPLWWDWRWQANDDEPRMARTVGYWMCACCLWILKQLCSRCGPSRLLCTLTALPFLPPVIPWFISFLCGPLKAPVLSYMGSTCQYGPLHAAPAALCSVHITDITITAPCYSTDDFGWEFA